MLKVCSTANAQNNGVRLLRPNRSIRRYSSQIISWRSYTEETKPKTTKANIHPQHKYTTTVNKHTKTKARFGRLVRLPVPGNRGCLIKFLMSLRPNWSILAFYFFTSYPVFSLLRAVI